MKGRMKPLGVSVDNSTLRLSGGSGSLFGLRYWVVRGPGTVLPSPTLDVKERADGVLIVDDGLSSGVDSVIVIDGVF